MPDPVDLQHMLARTDVTERIHQLARSRPDTQQQQFAQALMHDVEEQHAKPPPTAEADEVILHRERDEEKEQRKDRKPRQRSGEESPEQADVPEMEEGRHIDVLV